MHSIPRRYEQTIRRAYPERAPKRLRFVRDGLVNDVVIVDDELVCRFPKYPWAEEVLQREARALVVARRHLAVRVPEFERLEARFCAYRLLAGVPLTRTLLLRLPAPQRTAVLTEVVEFVRALHAIPEAELRRANIEPSLANRDRAWWLAFLDDLREHVFPHLIDYQRAHAEALFAPLLAGELDLAHRPRLIHGDLGPHHLLFDADRGRLAGVIDFGTAGLGDPAVDLASLLHAFGESLVTPLLADDPDGAPLLERARFWAGTLELQWALLGLRDGERSLAVAHIGGARDLELPTGSFPPSRGDDPAG